MSELRFSDRTKTILENFFKINAGMLFREGAELRSRAAADNLYAVAKITETIPQQFAVADLSVLLNIMSQYEEPALEFDGEDRAIIRGKEKGRKFVFTLAEPRMIHALKPGKVPWPGTTLAEFDVDVREFRALRKNVAVASLPHVLFRGNGQNVYAIGLDKKNSNSNNYEAILGATNANFEFFFDQQKIAVPLDSTYKVSVADAGGFYFTRWAADDIQYYIASEAETER